VRDNYVNVCDITPTVYDLLQITPPVTVKGIPQKPLDGVSFKLTLADPGVPTGKDTQFYTMLGTRGIWHKGWFANTVHAATPAGWSHFDKDRWELFHIEADRSQCHDLAGEYPDRLEELKALWFSEADKYNGLPLADLNILETMTRWRPYLSGTRESYAYYPGTADVGMGAAVEIQGRSFAAIGEVTIDTSGAERRTRDVRAGRPAAVRLQLPRRGRADDDVERRGDAGQAHVRRRLRAYRDGGGQPHAAWQRCALHRRR
jgi:arylsulfatase